MAKPGEPMQFGEPPPVPNDLPSMHDLVMQDMAARKQFGLDKYKSLLQPFNGRDPLKDLYEEILDAAVYIRQALWERDYGKEAENVGRFHAERMQLPKADVAVDVNDPGRCYCGGPEEVVYGHVYGQGYYCRRKVEGGK